MFFFLSIGVNVTKVVQSYVVSAKSIFEVFFICINWREKNEKQEVISFFIGISKMFSERKRSRHLRL